VVQWAVETARWQVSPVDIGVPVRSQLGGRKSTYWKSVCRLQVSRLV